MNINTNKIPATAEYFKKNVEVLLFRIYLSVLGDNYILEKSLNFEQQLNLNKSLKETVNELNLHASEDKGLTYMVRDTFIFGTISHLYKLTRLIRRSIILSWLALAQIVYSLYMIVVFNYHTTAIVLSDAAERFDTNSTIHFFIKDMSPFALLISHVAVAVITAFTFIFLKRKLAPLIQERNNFFVLFNRIPEKEITEAFDRISNALSSKMQHNEEV